MAYSFLPSYPSSPFSALKMETVFLPKRRYLPNSPHGVKTQKRNIVIFTAEPQISGRDRAFGK
jgi:hypothetical protein